MKITQFTVTVAANCLGEMALQNHENNTHVLARKIGDALHKEFDILRKQEDSFFPQFAFDVHPVEAFANKDVINDYFRDISDIPRDENSRLKSQVEVLAGCIADGITDEYGTPEAWRSAAKSILREFGMLKKLINERM